MSYIILYFIIPRTHTCVLINALYNLRNCTFSYPAYFIQYMLYSSTVKRVTKLCIQSAVDCNQLYLDHWTNLSINQYIYSTFSSLQYFVSFASNVIKYIWTTGPTSPLTNCNVSKSFLRNEQDE